jgi:hypothetical protein
VNRERRKQIKDIQKSLSELKNKLEEVRDDEDSYLSNMPENLFSSSKQSIIAQANVGDLDYCIGGIDDIIENLTSTINRKDV